MPAPDPVTLWFRPDAGVPNNSDLPVLLVRGAVPGAEAADIARLYRAHGWGGVWTWTVFDRHHFHATAHEALACVAGRGTLRLGGPSGRDVDLARGDLAVLPAGTGHRLVESTGGFAVVGGYPAGQEAPDLCWAGEADAETAAERVAGVPLPRTDPLAGARGPLMAVWR